MNKLKKLRKRMGLRQLDVARISNVGVTSLYYIEAGYDSRVSQKTKKKIAKALDKKVEEIFTD